VKRVAGRRLAALDFQPFGLRRVKIGERFEHRAGLVASASRGKYYTEIYGSTKVVDLYLEL